MIVLIDNYDSFTYNLVQYMADLLQEVRVFRNDKITIEEMKDMPLTGIIVSPGPGNPDSAGVSLAAARYAAESDIPYMGVCLGHQCLGQAAGAKIVQTNPMHGKCSLIVHNHDSLFTGLESPLKVTRYHSLIVDRATLPEDYRVTAHIDDIIMAIAHKTKPLFGVQFHPESIATDNGHKILSNFLKTIKTGGHIFNA